MTSFRTSIADVAALSAHAEARSTLAALGEAELAREAAIVSTVAAPKHTPPSRQTRRG